MRIVTLLGKTLAISVGIWGAVGQLSAAVQLADGTVYFVQPPRLVGATTTFNEADVWGATYYFTLSVPDNAGEPLQRVTIAQREGVENIRYNLKDTQAFEGTRRNPGARLPLGTVTKDQNTETISVTFDPPVSPGKTVTIALYPWRNPPGGVYLFGVTAFPPGEKVHGQFLGFGRIHFYRHRGTFLFK